MRASTPDNPPAGPGGVPSLPCHFLTQCEWGRISCLSVVPGMNVWRAPSCRCLFEEVTERGGVASPGKDVYPSEGLCVALL